MKNLLLLFSLLYPGLTAAGDIHIEGRVFTESGPFKGARTYVYRSYGDIHTGTPFYVSEPADEQGIYRAHMPEGEYFFTARGDKDGKEFFAYHGKNPIKLGKENLWITLIANEAKPPPVYSAGITAISGIATYKGQPVKGAYVAIYTPESSPFRGLGLRTESVQADGRFRLPLSPGKYVVIVKKSENGKGHKPLKKGDLFCYYPHNPLEVRQDMTVEIEVPCYPKDERTQFVDTPLVRTEDFTTIQDMASRSKTGIRGKVTDGSGKPVKGLVVLAYKTESPVFMMYHLSHGTEHTAETDGNGNYFIHLDEAGDYTMAARDTIGNGPHKGELYGLYQGNARHVVTYKAGELTEGVNITVGKLMAEPLTDISPLPAKAAVGRKGSGRAAAKRTITDQVIDTDTVWEGDVLIKGVVSVSRGATLTIKPGTVVKFSRIDRDKNGVGDGEILVEGRMVARGTKERRIVFASAEKNPQVNDWSYVQFLGAENGNVLEYCRFSRAYAGVMVHYSNVHISDCVFTDNNRGLHFNTANLTVEHNTFKNNKIGIRFMRFEGKISISKNKIVENDIGVLFVRQHVNAIDFGKPEKFDEPPQFVDNTICGNHKYNISLGEGQNQDIDVSNNWWCDHEKENIAKTIYDNGQDNELSQVVFSPIRTTVVHDGGARE